MELRAGPEARGVRLDAFLAGPLGSRSRAQRLIEAGAVTVDGAPAPKRLRLTGGEAIAVDEVQDRAPDAAAAEAAPFRVAYEDAHLLVVDKPAGVVVHPARGHAHGTLSQALAGRAGGGAPERAGIVHRLDRDTSGLLVVARIVRFGGVARAPRSPTSRWSAPCPGPRCCASGWRRGEPIRSASTSRPSGTRCAATLSTGPRVSWACAGSSCTPPGLRSPIPRTADPSTSPRRSQPTCARRCGGPRAARRDA